ncbi:MAG TPA: DUF1517 domain-containing protein [Sandaracinaceae bacterium LLY-WYZ-13_1]|nr:DUF1517 domain-containing protein [Sandaracinaceae bacterium LLY-WYZ-13_1]
MRKRWFRWALALVCLFWLGILAAPALAQRTGGSFGGGSFSSGGGGFSGGSSFGGGSSFSSGGGGFSYSGGGGGGGLPCGCTVPLFIGMIVLFVVISQAKKQGSMPSSHGARSWGQMDISAIRLGIDWRARRELQANLERMAQSGRTNTQAGLAELLRETVLNLRRAELSWLYCNIANYHPMSPAQAEGIFRQLAVDARSKFKEELVRNVDGDTSTREASEMRARPEEGEGVVVVTLIVAAKREILDVTSVDDADRIKALLDDLVAVANPHTLGAIEVIWSPAAENDRMSTAELEQFYPDLKKIDERSIAGRVFCGYCRGPFAMELLKCPHCGAPAPEPEQPSA